MKAFAPILCVLILVFGLSLMNQPADQVAAGPLRACTGPSCPMPTVNPAVDDTVAVDVGEAAEDACAARRPVARKVGKVVAVPVRCVGKCLKGVGKLLRRR